MAATPARAPKTWFQRMLVVVVFIVGVGGTLGFLVLSFGQVSGTEFAPDSFKRRDYAYFRIPLVRLQITPVVRWDTSNDLENHVGRNSLKGRRKIPAKRWDVATVNSGTRREAGDAAILCNYLDTKNEDDEFLWLKWTKSDEARAKPLWLAVHDAAKIKAYVCIPVLFEIAELQEDAKQLADEIDQYMAKTLSSMADDRAALQEFERAEELYAAALKYDEDNKPLKDKHDTLRKRLGIEVTDNAPSESIGS